MAPSILKIETGLFLLKPDALLMGEEEYMREMLRKLELTIATERNLVFNEEMLRRFYHDKQDPISSFMIGYLTTMPSRAFLISGVKTNEKLNALKREMRKHFGHDGYYTGTHCSDNQDCALREASILGINNSPKTNTEIYHFTAGLELAL